jgi:hypothetical protein
MSPPPPPAPTNPEDYQAIVKDSLIASVLGAGGMVARMLLSSEPLTFGWIARRLIAASLIGIFAGFALQEYVTSLVMRFACIGLAGAAANEIMEGAIKWLKGRINKETQGVTKGKPNGKTKRAKRKR